MDTTLLEAREHSFFAPQPKTNSAKIPREYRNYQTVPPKRADFFGPDLLLSQDETGAFSWAHLEDLYKRDADVTLKPIQLSDRDLREILIVRTLCLIDTDPRLSDFNLLSSNRRREVMISKSPHSHDTMHGLGSNIDWVASHLSGSRSVKIFTREESGMKVIDEAKTEDYWRAKSDISRDLEDKKNMRTFCARNGPVGVGPSDLSRKVCHSRVSHKEPKQSVPVNSESPSTMDTNDASALLPEVETPSSCELKERGRHSATYRILKFAGVSQERLGEEQSRQERKHARSEKKREESEESERPRRSIRDIFRNFWPIIRRRMTKSPRPIKVETTNVPTSPDFNLTGKPGGTGTWIDNQRRMELVEEWDISPLSLPDPMLDSQFPVEDFLSLDAGFGQMEQPSQLHQQQGHPLSLHLDVLAWDAAALTRDQRVAEVLQSIPIPKPDNDICMPSPQTLALHIERNRYNHWNPQPLIVTQHTKRIGTFAGPTLTTYPE